ncbi:MAG: hypothetical protein RMJ51_02755 [Candidatus Calescibacterium sp.]|nr:hypothetical protein [Candidatus Calescibacterium sp.]MDW8195147.1 hypothetical protein [Candidatus Calescibacterium sp.]
MGKHKFDPNEFKLVLLSSLSADIPYRLNSLMWLRIFLSIIVQKSAKKSKIED